MNITIRNLLSKFNNSKGYTLPYVLLIVAILGLFVPVLTNMNTNRAMKDIKRHNDETANYLAESSIESFVRYLLNLRDTNQPIGANISKYYGNLGNDPSNPSYWQQYSLPDGTPIKYHFECGVGDKNVIHSSVDVFVGTGKYQSQKVLTYSISGPSGSTGNSGSVTGSSYPLISTTLAQQNSLNKWGFYGSIITSSVDANFTSDFNNLTPTNPTYTISASPEQTSFSELDQIPNVLANSTNTFVIHASSTTFNLDSTILGKYTDLNLANKTDQGTALLYLANSIVPGQQIQQNVIYIDNPSIGKGFTVNISSDLLYNTLIIVNGNVNFVNQNGINGNTWNGIGLGSLSKNFNGDLGTVLFGNVVSNNTISQDPGSKFTVLGTLAAQNSSNSVFGNNNQNDYINPQNDNYVPVTYSYQYASNGGSWSPDPVKH